MSEVASLSETLEKAILDWCSANDGGFPMGFVCIVNLSDGGGENELRICTPEHQSMTTNLGLVGFAKLGYEAEAQASWMGCSGCDECEADE
jgi:hypothetical protein